MYGQYAPQPELGFLTWRQGILGTANLKLSQNWVATTALRYDIDARKFSSTQFGLGYIDDCFIFALNYITDSTSLTAAPCRSSRRCSTIASC